jgi:hypothetical protein
MLELDEIRRQLTDLNLAKVAQAARLPYGRVWRVMHTTHEPSYSTAAALSKYLENRTTSKAA